MASALVLMATGTPAWAGQQGSAVPRVNGPQSDYPVVTGDPYEIDGITYTPVDVMNYDEVGFITPDNGLRGVAGSHHTLPVPSYVEVTSLVSGRTILVRIEQRGPMASNDLIALSSAALAQLGSEPGEAVRVRRVNPPEFERAKLRAGETAPLRMDTPLSLVAVLKRKLPADSTTSPPPLIEEAAAELAMEASTIPAVEPEATAPIASGFIVQAATFSVAENARKAAMKLGGAVVPSGKFFKVRTGPFTSRGEAEASLAKVRTAGYTDARIYTSG